MKNIIITLMNWLARPFPNVSAIILTIFASLLFLGGVAVAYHGYITEFLSILHADKLRLAVRIGALMFFSGYCTLGCLCRVILQFWPELTDEQRQR